MKMNIVINTPSYLAETSSACMLFLLLFWGVNWKGGVAFDIVNTCKHISDITLPIVGE